MRIFPLDSRFAVSTLSCMILPSAVSTFSAHNCSIWINAHCLGQKTKCCNAESMMRSSVDSVVIFYPISSGFPARPDSSWTTPLSCQFSFQGLFLPYQPLLHLCGPHVCFREIPLHSRSRNIFHPVTASSVVLFFRTTHHTPLHKAFSLSHSNTFLVFPYPLTPRQCQQ